MILLKTYGSIPLRPTVRIDLLFDPVERALLCTVTEGDNNNIVLKYSDSGILFRSGKNWMEFRPFRGVSTLAEAVCFMVLQYSDTMCPVQARLDFPIASGSPFWAALLADMETLYSMASVMLS